MSTSVNYHQVNMHVKPKPQVEKLSTGDTPEALPLAPSPSLLNLSEGDQPLFYDINVHILK